MLEVLVRTTPTTDTRALPMLSVGQWVDRLVSSSHTSPVVPFSTLGIVVSSSNIRPVASNSAALRAALRPGAASQVFVVAPARSRGTLGGLWARKIGGEVKF